MEKKKKNERKNSKGGGHESLVVERRGEKRRAGGGAETKKRKIRRKSEPRDRENGQEDGVIQPSGGRGGALRRRSAGEGEETLKVEVGKKRKRVRGQRREALQSKNSNLAESAGEYAGFTMFEPRRKKKENDEVISVVQKVELSAPPAGLRPARFLDKMRARLSGGRFRMLNETLYTCSGKEAFELFKKDPAAFTVYHTGYQEQMSRWPLLPIEVVVSWLKSRSSKLVVADFGCGDAKLAKSVKNRVFSLDLISTDPSIIACNMAQTPLDTSSVDVAVFCLSLMGTDYPSFIQEANRVLKPSGSLLIAEVRSRFDTENGGTSPQQFIGALQSLGFALISQDVSNKMFIMFYLQKQKGLNDLPKRSKQWPELKACIYKRR